MENWQIAQLSDDEMSEIQTLEERLGVSLVAYESVISEEANSPIERGTSE